MELGFNSLGLESNLQPPDNATYGLDTVLLGLSSATDGPSLPNQILATLTGDEFVQGTFGLGQQPTNLTDFTEPHPSFLTTLHSQHMIPSLSWAYTAGAKYR